MERLKIDLPDAMEFETELDVRIGDVNYGRHLGNDAVLSLLHEARLRFLARHGFSELNAGGPGLILTDASVVYRAQARHGDRLRIGVSAGGHEKTCFELLYRITRPADGRDVARARTVLAFFDYTAGRPARMPDAFRTTFWKSE